MSIIDRLHKLADRIGVKPAVIDAFVAAVVLAAFNYIVYGTLDVDGLRLAVGLLLIGLVGVAAPPAAGVSHEAVLAEKPELKRKTQALKAAK